ncbi:MAG: hypothetical protein WA876_08170 [Candidatus Acidiferrales bacterium]
MKSLSPRGDATCWFLVHQRRPHILPAMARHAVPSRGEVTIYRQPWKNGKAIGSPQVALKLPFAFPLFYGGGNAYDFSRDLSTIIYTRPGDHADLYLAQPEITPHRIAGPSSSLPRQARSVIVDLKAFLFVSAFPPD